MAKYRTRSTGYESGKTITTKSWFGSHADMIVDPTSISQEEEKGFAEWLVVETKGENHANGERVVCKDDKGYYMTYKSRLDNGLADPNRYSGRH